MWDTIRLGLEGGGLSGVAASALVLRYQDEPLMDYLPLAGRIVAAAVNGVPKAADAAGNAATEGEGTPPRRPLGLLRRRGGRGLRAGGGPRMTLAEWHVVVAAFIAAHGPPEAGGSEDEFLAVLAEEMAAGRA